MKVLISMFVSFSTIACIFVVAGDLLGRQPAYARPHRQPTPGEIRQAETFQKAGRQADTSQIPTMVQVLEQKPEPDVAEGAVHALALMGATDAVPTIDKYIEGDMADAYGYQKPFVVDDFKVAKARLLAEDAGKKASAAGSQADAKTHKFFEVLSLSPGQLNTAVTEYFKHGPEEMNKPAPLELKAMRELADIAYQGAYQSFTALPAVSGVDFTSDAISSLMVQLAPLPRAGRAAWLVQDLAQTKQVHRSGSLTQSKADEERLAIAEGIPASDAAASLLQNMDIHHSQYSSIQFTVLFDVLEGVGDKKRDALLLHFSQDADPYIAQQALTCHQMLNAR